MQLKLNHQDPGARQPLRINMPFVREATGLGDAIAAATAAVGVKPR